MAPKSKLSRPAKRIVMVLAFALVVHVFVIPQIGGAREAIAVLDSVNPLLLGLAVVLEAAAFWVYAEMTRHLLPVEHRPGIWLTLGAVMASTGVNHVVPGGAATTGAVNYRLLGRAGVPAKELGFALGTQAIGSAVVLNVVLWVALIVSIPTSGFHVIYVTAAAVGAVLMTAFSAAVAAMLRGRDRFADRAARLIGRLPHVQEDRVRATMVNLADLLAVLAQDRARLRMVLMLATANWLLDAGALWVTLSAFHHRPGVVGLLVAYGLANVMAAIPVSPGGLGVIEAILIPTLVVFGTPPAEASVGVVAYRLVNFWLPIPIGAASYVAIEATSKSERRRGFRGEINSQVELRSGSATPVGSDPVPPAS